MQTFEGTTVGMCRSTQEMPCFVVVLNNHRLITEVLGPVASYVEPLINLIKMFNYCEDENKYMYLS
jgi:hypothetical protein